MFNQKASQLILAISCSRLSLYLEVPAFTSTLFLTILAVLFCSCNSNIKSKDKDQYVIASTDSTETGIDTTSWLRPSKGIRGIFEDSRGNLWFSSTDFVCVFDGKNLTYFNKEDGLSGTGMVHEDQGGTIWIESGFETFSYDGERFSSHLLKPDTTGNKWGARATDIWFQKGIEQFGNTGGPPGVYRCRDGNIAFLAFPLPESDNADNIYHPTTGAIKGKDGTLWFGTMEVVVGFNSGSFTLIGREEMGRTEDPGPVGIRGLYVDSKGNLWMADNGSGYFVWDGDTTINFTKSHHLDKGDTDGNTLHRAFSVAEDDEGNMWFGTVYSGIWRYNGQSFTNFIEKDGVRSDNIWTIYKTKQGELLFAGENPGAVYKFNGNTFDRVY